MSKIKDFEDLEVWKDAVHIGVMIYDMTASGTISKDYVTKDQMRRSALSISNNIAEGFEHNSNPIFIRYLRYAKGSAGELRSIFWILQGAKMIDDQIVEQMNVKLRGISNAIGGLIKYLKEYEMKKD